MTKGLVVKFTTAHERAGWIKCSPWHWQIKIDSGTLDYWPSRDKWMWDRAVHLGSFEQIKAFIATCPKIAAPKPSLVYHGSDRVPVSDIRATHDERGWKLPCPICGGGLWWRRNEDAPWVCDRCDRYKGRGLAIRWLTTPAYSMELERMSRGVKAA